MESLSQKLQLESGRSGDMTLSVRPTVQGESVHHQEDWGLIESLLQSG